jgi:hypothetical protein
LTAGAIDHYRNNRYRHWDLVRLGCNANLPDLLAALLPSQIEKVEPKLLITGWPTHTVGLSRTARFGCLANSITLSARSTVIHRRPFVTTQSRRSTLPEHPHGRDGGAPPRRSPAP